MKQLREDPSTFAQTPHVSTIVYLAFANGASPQCQTLWASSLSIYWQGQAEFLTDWPPRPTDRVFVHALNTVKRIPRTGSARPPPSDRLKLYGLYKQSMEGNVEGMLKRPDRLGPDQAAEQEKWDAWSAQHGLSRTEAKCNYITTLIETMHKYASTTPESRELVAQLEFVWDQIKSKYTSSALSSSSIPQHHSSALPKSQSQRLHQQQKQYRPRSSVGAEPGRRMEITVGRGEELQILSPTGLEHCSSSEDEEEPLRSVTRRQSIELGDPITISQSAPGSDPRTRKWRRKIEQTLVKMTTEIAALRESLDFVKATPRGGRAWILLYTLSFLGSFLRHLIIDALAMSLLVFLLGRGDERVISSLRTLAQVLRERFQILSEWKGVRKRP